MSILFYSKQMKKTFVTLTETPKNFHVYLVVGANRTSATTQHEKYCGTCAESLLSNFISRDEELKPRDVESTLFMRNEY